MDDDILSAMVKALQAQVELLQRRNKTLRSEVSSLRQVAKMIRGEPVTRQINPAGHGSSSLDSKARQVGGVRPEIFCHRSRTAPH